VLCASASNATSANLAAIGNVFAKRGNVFVIDVSDLVTTETARLLLDLLEAAGEIFGFCFRVRLERAPIVVLLYLGPPKEAEWLVF